MSVPAGIFPPVMMRTHCPGLDGPVEEHTRVGRPDKLQGHLAVRTEVRYAHRVAVHGGVVVSRDHHRRDHVLGEDPTKGCPDGYALDAVHRLEERSDELPGFRHRHGVRIVVVGAARGVQRLGLVGHGGLSGQRTAAESSGAILAQMMAWLSRRREGHGAAPRELHMERRVVSETRAQYQSTIKVKDVGTLCYA